MSQVIRSAGVLILGVILDLYWGYIGVIMGLNLGVIMESRTTQRNWLGRVASKTVEELKQGWVPKSH